MLSGPWDSPMGHIETLLGTIVTSLSSCLKINFEIRCVSLGFLIPCSFRLKWDNLRNLLKNFI